MMREVKNVIAPKIDCMLNDAMDDITKAQIKKFGSLLKNLQPKSRAMLAYLYGYVIDQDKVKEPVKTLQKFMESVIAFDRKNNGQYKQDECEAIIELTDKFRQFFEDSELSTTFHNANKAANKASDILLSQPLSNEYNQIMNRLHRQYDDHMLESDPEFVEEYDREQLVFMFAEKWMYGAFGLKVDRGDIQLVKYPFIDIKRSMIANKFSL